MASPRRRVSSSQALRNVAGGVTEHAEALDDEDEAGMDGEEPVVNGVSPMSSLSNTLSSIGIVGSAGRPPRSPTKACRSPRAGWSPRAGASADASAAAARASPRGGAGSPRVSIAAAGKLRGEASSAGGGLGRGFFSSGSSSLPEEPAETEEEGGEEEEQEVNLTMALVPLEERLQSKEKAWESERRELVIRAEESLRVVKSAEERSRELEKRKSDMEEERHMLDAELRRLRGEIEQRESKTAESFWQRTVAADREKTRLEAALDQAQAKVATLSNEKSELEAELLPIQSEAASYRARFTEAEKVASRVLRAEEALRFAEVQLDVMKTEFGATSAQLMAMQTELAQQKAGARKQLEEKERKSGDAVASMKREMERLKEAICVQADRVVEAAAKSKQASAEGGDQQLVVATTDPSAALMSSEAARIRQQELASLRSELDIERERGAHRQRLLEEAEDDRRRMHNIIQELRGSVRVFVRARPFLKSDGEDAAEQGADVVCCGSDSCSVAVVPPDNPNRAISCAFDHVFGGHASQEDVFKEVSGFVQSALDGFKVCLFSYGQTGSGKTHTMSGSGTGMMRGIVPRAVEHILARVGDLQDGPWSYSVQASFLEIYNEELRDLLVDHHGDRCTLSYLRIVFFFPCTGDREQGLGELDEIMSVAQRARSVASTAMNAQSSRSHSVFTLWLTGSDASTGTTLKGVLHLVDLAGSERLDRSGVGNDAQRLKETQNINKSLSCLADVFAALSAKSSHIPFRNSKLTYLMQDCLSGDGKALMFVNVSPTAPSANETVCSLRFANQVSQVQLGKATRQLSLSKPTSSRGGGGGGGGGGRPPSSGNSPTRLQASRATRTSGSASSLASTAPPSPRTSAGSTTRGGSGSFGFGRASAGGRRTSTNTPASPSRTRRTATGTAAAGGSAVGRARLSSSSAGPPSPRTLGRGGARAGASGRPSFSSSGTAPARGSVKGMAKGGGRASVSGGRVSVGGARSSVAGARVSVGGARQSVSARGPRVSEDARAKSVGGGGGGAGVEAKLKKEEEEGIPEGRTSFSGSTRPSSAISRINEALPPSPNPHAAVDKRPRLSVDEDGGSMSL
eukprot:jgi/Undpi1/1161/HiC_scaffold_10.g04623.m1